jgi:hypothetical protein
LYEPGCTSSWKAACASYLRLVFGSTYLVQTFVTLSLLCKASTAQFLSKKNLQPYYWACPFTTQQLICSISCKVLCKKQCSVIPIAGNETVHFRWSNSSYWPWRPGMNTRQSTWHVIRRWYQSRPFCKNFSFSLPITVPSCTTHKVHEQPAKHNNLTPLLGLHLQSGT